MNNRERAHAILHYEDYDRMPVVHFGYWNETLDKWAKEGHITEEQARSWGDGNPTFGWEGSKGQVTFNRYSVYSPHTILHPAFERKLIEEFPDGSRHILNEEGTVVLEKEGAGSIPAEIEHLLTDRTA